MPNLKMERWTVQRINKPWLDNAIQRGDEVILATRPIDSSDTSLQPEN